MCTLELIAFDAATKILDDFRPKVLPALHITVDDVESLVCSAWLESSPVTGLVGLAKTDGSTATVVRPDAGRVAVARVLGNLLVACPAMLVSMLPKVTSRAR